CATPVRSLLGGESDQPVTLGRLAELGGRVWLLGVAAAVAMLLAGVLVAVRTPVAGGRDAGAPDAGTPAGSVLRCALRLALVTAVALAVLVRLTGVSVDASLSVLGFDAFGAGLELDRKSTRLNSSHVKSSYAVFCLKKKTIN